jgi:hypothetical protein
MKDNYVGDIGDYAKLILLRQLQKIKGLEVGVNWYYNPEEEKNMDGLHIDYLCFDKKNLEGFDEDLYSQLREIVQADYDFRKGKRTDGQRSIGDLNLILENEKISNFKEAVPSYRTKRGCWVNRSLDILSKSNFVFLDPDNSISYGNKKGNKKHVLPREIEEYLKKGKSVMVYDHRDRKPEKQYRAKFNFNKIKPTCFIEANLCTKRTYVFYLQSHESEIKRVLRGLEEKSKELGGLFSNFRTE